jgi:integrase
MANPRRRRKTVRTETYGKGSVFQDKRGVWWYQPPPRDGKRLTRIRADSEQGAKLAQRDHLAKLEAQIAVTGIPTVSEWFDFWFREHVAPGLKPKTLEGYRYLIGHYITPAIGRLRLDTVSSDQLIVLQNQLRKHLSVRTVARIHELLDRAFKKAVVSRKLAYNPMDAIERPRVPRSKQASFTAQEVAAIRREIAGARLELLFDLGLLQGLRRGELLGLLISEYDAVRGTILVTGQVQTIKADDAAPARTGRHSSPKSEAGKREVPLTPRQQQLVSSHLARLQEERRQAGLDWKEHGLLFPSEKGTPILPRNLYRHYQELLIRAGVRASEAPAEKKAGVAGPKPTRRVAIGKSISLHRMRHTAASRLDSVKATPNVRKAILGHEPGDVSESYVHPDLSELRAALIDSEVTMLREAA